MKIKILTLLGLLLARHLTAQSFPAGFSDHLNPEKKVVLEKFIPMKLVNDRLPAGLTLMPADTFISRIGAFKAVMERRIAREKDQACQQLRRQDLAYFIYGIRLNYQLRYGLDYNKLPKPDEEMKPGIVPAVPLEHSPEERKRLAALVTPENDLNNAVLFKTSDAYRNWVNQVLYYKARKFPVDTALGFGAEKLSLIKAVKAEITDPFLREYLMYVPALAAVKSIRKPEAREAVYQDFMQSVTNLVYRAEISEVYNNFKNMSVNALAPDFNYLDINGKQVSLKSLRGKYVYIDLWATWCGPCKQQFPFLAALEETYKGRMHFISLSIDKPEDKAAWQAYVKSNKLGGIQLLADKGPKSDFIKKFNVSGIPRFLLINPQGRIVSADAKAPADPLLKTQLADLLKYN